MSRPGPVSVELHPVFQEIARRAHRLYFLYSGRGAGKSWGVAIIVLLIGTQEVIRVLFSREVQRSLRDSSHKLLSDLIDMLGLASFYRVTREGIFGRNGTELIFAGLHKSGMSLRSYEGIDMAIVDEAQQVSKSSIDSLIPTIRREGSVLIFLYNPLFEYDPVVELMEAHRDDPRAFIRKMSYRDNPALTDTLRDDIRFMRDHSPEDFEHVYEGGYLVRSDAQIYRNWRKGIVSRAEMPAHAVRIAGADWGLNHPIALIEGWLWDRNIYIDRERYSPGIELDDIPAFFAGDDIVDPPRWENPHKHYGIPDILHTEITADNHRPEIIRYLAKRGFRIRPAKKGPNSLMDGVTFLRAQDIVVNPLCTNTIKELTRYSFAVDEDTGRVTDVPVDDHNHAMDALRYATEPFRKPDKRRVAPGISCQMV